MNFQKAEQRRPRARSIIREFALNTSTHALPGIARSQSITNKIFWSISFIIFAGIMMYFVAQSIISYFQYPTQTSVSISIVRSQEFPAVSICNYGASRYDRTVVDYLNYTNSKNLTNVVVAVNGTYHDSYFQYIDDFFVSKINSGGFLANYVFTLEDMLISCSYNGEQCEAGDFIAFESATYGNCYTFNAKTANNSKSPVRLTNQNGGSGKLQLQLYAHSHNYVPLQTEDVSVGMVAMIHDNTQLPLIDDAGMYLSPGKRYKLAFNKKKNHLLSSPYSVCTNDIPLAMQTMFNRYKGADYAYSQGVCNILCTQSYLFQECGCVDPNYWSARSVVLPNTEKVIEATLCDLSDMCYKNGTGRLSNSDSLWEEYCSHCKPACSTVEFTVSSSAAKTITNSYLTQTKNFVEKTSVPLPANWTGIWSDEIKENYIAVDFVSQSNSVENFTEEASMSRVDVLSNVGGHTGLWIGISFLSIMELVEMLFRLIRHQLYRCLNRVRPEINHIA